MFSRLALASVNRRLGRRSFSVLSEIRGFQDGCVSSQKIDTLTQNLLDEIMARPLEQPIFVQAVKEVITSLKPLFQRHPIYLEALPTICTPERSHLFQVPWVDDEGIQRINHGYRVQFNQALGPYKGGLRFHPTVDLSVIKFLAFEQTFKNALTGLPLGSAKGGSDFDPKGRSNREVYKFCRAFMTQLFPYIGPDRDVPAGDIGVGAREIGYMYGQYKRLTREFHGVLTGKQVGWGGSHIRPEATGYGLIYITDYMLRKKGGSLNGKRCAISGAGNVAQFAAEKLIELGAKVISFSDSDGTIYEADGFDKEGLQQIMALKSSRKRCSDYVNFSKTAKYFVGANPWSLETEIDFAFPCATQNEIGAEDAQNLINKGCKGLFEGANMPSTIEAVAVLQTCKDLVYIPGKAANAGGVAVSCLEMAQNSARMVWSREKVDRMLKEIMERIYDSCEEAAKDLQDEGNLQLGANAAGFRRVADAMFQQGLVFHPDTY
uniref:Glutamate dehydrogenase n=3 Tax=Hirondellea gigas TaxID=1518452 RepID=A0A6A7G0M4_9CRUS